MDNIIEIKKLNYKVKDTTIFKDFNLSIKTGSFTCIAGNNTSGKTTLIKLINGTLPSNNTITIGYSYVNDKRYNDHAIELGTVYGNNLNYFMFDDVYREMTFPLENLNLKPSEIEKRILEISKFFNVNKILDKKTYDLTNREKQELLIVLALLHKPKILLLDNALSMMDRISKEHMLRRLREYQIKENLTIVLTTTNLEDTLDSDYLYILNKGSIAIEGRTLEVLKEDTRINRLGLEIPFMVDLSLKLEFYDLLGNIETDMDRMVNTLWK